MTKMDERTLTAEDEIRRLREDTLARNHCGYFKLWRMKKTGRGSGGWERPPSWVKGSVIGIYSTREPCEEFLALIHHGPEASYEFCSFTVGVDHIRGAWGVELNDDGALQSGAWKWDIDPDGKSYCHGSNRNTGYGRTKEEAVAKARAYMKELDEFIRDERPKRAKGCYCQPRERSCGPCAHAEQERKKQECGCPHCKGDHER